MKKTLALILALIMALSLVACGQATTDEQSDADADKEITIGLAMHNQTETWAVQFKDLSLIHI